MVVLFRSRVKPWSEKKFECMIKDYELNEMVNENNKKVDVLVGDHEGKKEDVQQEIVGIGDVVKREPLFPEAERTSSKDIQGKTFLLKGVAKLSDAIDGDYYVLSVDVDGMHKSFINGGKVVMKQVRDILKGIDMNSDILKSEELGIPIYLTKLVSCVLVLQKPVGKGKDYWVLKDPSKVGE